MNDVHLVVLPCHATVLPTVRLPDTDLLRQTDRQSIHICTASAARPRPLDALFVDSTKNDFKPGGWGRGKAARERPRAGRVA